MKRHKAHVQDFMTENPQVITPTASLFDAYNLMFDNEVRRLPVMTKDELVGIITLSDIQRAMPPAFEDNDLETQLELAARNVGDIMTDDPITVAPDDTIQEAAERMLDNQVSGLPVMENDHLVGIITESDIFRLVVDWWATEE